MKGQQQTKQIIQATTFLQLFRFANRSDKFWMLASLIGTIIFSASRPFSKIVNGNMINNFSISESNPSLFLQQNLKLLYYSLELTLVVFISSWIMFACWMIAGQRQGIRSLLSQEIGWFDLCDQSTIASRFAADTIAFQNAVGEASMTLIRTLLTTIFAFIIAYIKGWQLAFVMTGILPLCIMTTYLYINAVQNRQKKVNESYSKAGGMAQEKLGAIKTVKALNGEQYQKKIFINILDDTWNKIRKYFIFAAISLGLLTFSIFACQALGFWYGLKLAKDGVQNIFGPYTGGDVFSIVTIVLMGGENIGQITPALRKIGQGKTAAARIFAIIDRKPNMYIHPNPIKLNHPKGIIKFHNVSFSYPKQPQKIILSNLNIQIIPGKTNAFVGESGCGKSTIMQLLLRFYDPSEGYITLDGIDIKQFQIEWLRSIMGYVGQQPVLFATTIKENLLMAKQNATDVQIYQALKIAEAYDFIQHLQNKEDTYVGSSGSQLSGGQKQRIAIARAILKKPIILLLDQATSALDRKNQSLIQNTLDKISTGTSGITTITVAHRQKSIINAQVIFVIQNGKVKQKGKFNQLNRFKFALIQQIEEQQDLIDQNFLNLSKLKKINIRKQSSIYNLSQLDQAELNTNNQQQKLKMPNIFDLFKYYDKQDIFIFVIGIIFAILNGFVWPIFSILLGKIIEVASKISIQRDTTFSDKDSLYLFFLAIGGFMVSGIYNYIFPIIGERFTKKLRIDCYYKILKMPVSWFDQEENKPGLLNNRLTVDCSAVKSLASQLIGIGIYTMVCMIAGVSISFYFSWRMTMIAIAMLPLFILAYFMKVKYLIGLTSQSDEAYKQSSNVISQICMNIRTVYSYNMQKILIKKYDQKLQKPYNLAIKKGNVSGALTAFSQGIMFIVFGVIYYSSSILVVTYKVNFGDVMIAAYQIIYMAKIVGYNLQFMPDIAESINAAQSLFQILQGKDQDQIQQESQRLSSKPKLQPLKLKGKIQVKNLKFKYPNREKEIFQNLNLKVDQGSKVAFVGHSGCGKSTLIQLLLRYYDPIQGQIRLDGINIKQYDIHYLRSVFGVVSQEPVLFSDSIIKNIKYNKQDSTYTQIRTAAQQANALTFIQSEQNDSNTQDNTKEDYHKGFQKSVGVKGSHISGGQKQRVAIARTILRKPKILLLDQATSALDHQNEQIVQDSLDKIMEGLTTITVAHRIQTIKNSDLIYVFQDGKIVQKGNYKELIERKGYFYNLENGYI